MIIEQNMKILPNPEKHLAGQVDRPWRQNRRGGGGRVVDWGEMGRGADMRWGQSSRSFYFFPNHAIVVSIPRKALVEQTKHHEYRQLESIWFRPRVWHLHSGRLFTLGSELGQFFTERVLGLFQLPPLLFHVLHVVCQGLDLGFVL